MTTKYYESHHHEVAEREKTTIEAERGRILPGASGPDLMAQAEASKAAAEAQLESERRAIGAWIGFKQRRGAIRQQLEEAKGGLARAESESAPGGVFWGMATGNYFSHERSGAVSKIAELRASIPVWKEIISQFEAELAAHEAAMKQFASDNAIPNTAWQ